MGSTFEIINVVGTSFHNIGYWPNRTGLLVTPPENTSTTSDNQYHIKPKLSDIIWPGERKTMPWGWVHGKELVIGVPRKTCSQEFVKVNGSNPVYCCSEIASLYSIHI